MDRVRQKLGFDRLIFLWLSLGQPHANFCSCHGLVTCCDDSYETQKFSGVQAGKESHQFPEPVTASLFVVLVAMAVMLVTLFVIVEQAMLDLFLFVFESRLLALFIGLVEQPHLFFFVVVPAAQVVVVLVVGPEVHLWQNVHERDVGQGPDGNQEGEAHPPVQSLLPVRIVN